MASATPPSISRYLISENYDRRSYAFVGLDQENMVTLAGGELAHFGLSSIKKGEAILEKYVFLEGLLPGEDEPVVIHNTQFDQDQFVDVHLFTDREGQWVLFIDNTDIGKADQAAQQERLDKDLLNEMRKS